MAIRYSKEYKGIGGGLHRVLVVLVGCRKVNLELQKLAQVEVSTCLDYYEERAYNL